MESKSFNIFRINCLINDKEAQNLTGILESIVCELLYENGNKRICAKEVHNYLCSVFHLKIDYDFLKRSLSKSKSFEIEETEFDICFVLKGDRLLEIGKRIQTESIEEWIVRYCKDKQLGSDIEKGIHEILYSALYENINTFVSNNIKSLLSQKLTNQHNQEIINHFNSFLEWESDQKNESLYKSFLKATEFAILTSGRGVQSFSEKIFDNKTYTLDSNIIFRLLGVGGKERQDSLNSLMRNCVDAGIKFKFSNVSEIEFNRKVKERVDYFNNLSSRKDFDILESISQNGVHMNYGFETLYVELRKDNKVKNPDDYLFFLKTELRKLKEKYSIENEAIQCKLDVIKLKKLQNHLFNAKKKENVYSYTKKAATVDATNVMYVNSVRGANNHNYSDIKSFYLTTDRTLNKILSNEEGKVAETILPSQLFILHNGEKITKSEQDFKDFSKFLKKRTTQFKLSGNAVFEYINEVRAYTNNENQIVEVIKSYSDYKYQNPQPIKYENDIAGFKEYALTKIDKQISKLTNEVENKKIEFQNAINDLPRKFKLSKNIALYTELLLVLILGVIIYSLSTIKLYSSLPLIIVIIDKIFSFFLNDRFGLFTWLSKKIFFSIITSSSFYKYNTSKEEYLREAKKLTNTNKTDR